MVANAPIYLFPLITGATVKFMSTPRNLTSLLVIFLDVSLHSAKGKKGKLKSAALSITNSLLNPVISTAFELYAKTILSSLTPMIPASIISINISN